MRKKRTLGALLFAAAVALGAPAGASAGVDDFDFDSFHAEYRLDRDAEGHSTLHTRETLVAQFPVHDQNRGIKREIPRDYQGIDTQLDVLAATNEHGSPRDYTVKSDGEFEVITSAVPQGTFVYGQHTYVFEYTQRDVTAYFSNTDSDEFYWDVNGTGWPQRFGSVSAELLLPADLAAELTGHAACYYGLERSSRQCDIVRTDHADGSATLQASVGDIAEHENLTIAVGFAPGTFAKAEPSGLQKNAALLTTLPLFGLIAMGFVAFLARFTTWRDAPAQHPTAPSATPPAGVDLVLAAQLLNLPKRTAVSSMIDLAVRGNVRLLEHLVPLDQMLGGSVGRALSLRGRPAPMAPTFGLRAVTATGLSPAERIFAALLFPPQLTPGATRWFQSYDSMLAQRIEALVSESKHRAVDEGYRRKPSRFVFGLLVALGVVSVILGGISLCVYIAMVERNPTLTGNWFAGLAGLTCGVFLVIYAARQRPLTAKGRAAVDQLRGVEQFLRTPQANMVVNQHALASAPRQYAYASASGHPLPAPGTDDLLQVELAERLLPYAVLFGLEQQWLRALGQYYAVAEPRWIESNTPIPLAAMPGQLMSFITVTAASYSGVAFNSGSDSGGSGGGGSSGDGGGGGGGGGV